MPLRVFDSVKALAFIGDLSMGQPTDHSLRTAWLAAKLALAVGLDPADSATVREASLLRWSGFTGYAAGFADISGDDIATLDARLGWIEPLGGAGAVLAPLVRHHCDVSSKVACLLGLVGPTETTLRQIVDVWEGKGIRGVIPMPAYVVALAGDFEAFSRVYGIDRAIAFIRKRTGLRYPAGLVSAAVPDALSWLQELEGMRAAHFDRVLVTPGMQHEASAELVGDVIDLKVPWMAGFSRAVAVTAAAICTRLKLDEASKARVYQAALMHGIGRAAVPNSIWNQTSRLPASAWELVRLVPYWTSRAGKQASALADAAELASYAYERLDGSGYFRGVRGDALTLEARVLAVAVAWVAMRSWRPWRAALPANEAALQLRKEVANGRLCGKSVDALLAGGEVFPELVASPARAVAQNSRLSEREIEVLLAISRGASNKEIARELALSPSTVGTHVENIFRKLDCSTRVEATVKASALGLL
jgi:HD-GYP domain-containing protein (c-di-GMP phosphodiesterase class II)